MKGTGLRTVGTGRCLRGHLFHELGDVIAAFSFTSSLLARLFRWYLWRKPLRSRLSRPMANPLSSPKLDQSDQTIMIANHFR